MTYDETTYLAHEKLEPIKRQCFFFGHMAMKTLRRGMGRLEREGNGVNMACCAAWCGWRSFC
jgi:hypothetical protein